MVYRLNILNDDKHIENIDFYKYISSKAFRGNCLFKSLEVSRPHFLNPRIKKKIFFPSDLSKRSVRKRHPPGSVDRGMSDFMSCYQGQRNRDLKLDKN